MWYQSAWLPSHVFQQIFANVTSKILVIPGMTYYQLGWLIITIHYLWFVLMIEFQFMFCLLPSFIFMMVTVNQEAQMKKVDQ